MAIVSTIKPAEEDKGGIIVVIYFIVGTAILMMLGALVGLLMDPVFQPF